MVGSSLLRKLKRNSKNKFILANKKELDLRNQTEVNNFFKMHKPHTVYMAAAKVGGIIANYTYPADFIYDNLMIQCNIIKSSFDNGVKKLLFIGSSCIYPKFSDQPIKEESLLSGKLEKTNEPYAVSKIAGIKLCESFNRQFSNSHNIDYRCVMPTNLYGPGDSYTENLSHVIPALIKRFHEAKLKKLKRVSVWGTGKAKREFLYVDDLANACIYVMNLKKKEYNSITSEMESHINIGFGEDVSIKFLSNLVSNIVGYKGKIEFDKSKPDGTPRKILDSKLIKSLGWKPTVDLKHGLAKTYNDYLNKLNKVYE